MKRIRVSARTLDDAITEALIELGITSDQLSYDVIEKGSEGFLGIGRKQAVIEAWKKEEIKSETESILEELKTDISSVGEEFSEKLERDVQPVSKEEKAPKKKPVEEKKIEKQEEKNVEKEVHQEQKEKPSRVIEDEEEEKDALGPVLLQTQEACRLFLEEIFKNMGLTVNLSLSIDEEGALSIDMEGDQMGLLIGKRGQTLDSLQYLTNRVANKQQEDFVRVKLDTENYRARRKKTLENLARNLASKVKRTRKAASLEPMNPYERRIIHSALQGDPRVSTHSEGEEPYRKVVITYNRKGM